MNCDTHGNLRINSLTIPKSDYVCPHVTIVLFIAVSEWPIPMSKNGKPIAVCTYKGILFSYKRGSGADKFHNSDECQTLFSGAMGWLLVKRLLHEHEDTSSNPQNSCNARHSGT